MTDHSVSDLRTCSAVLESRPYANSDVLRWFCYENIHEHVMPLAHLLKQRTMKAILKSY